MCSSDLNVERVIIGKQHEAQLALITLLCRGHLLIEDVPGVGKTTLINLLPLEQDERITTLGPLRAPFPYFGGKARIAAAVEVGYRAFDTAQWYGNEADTGAALKASGVARRSASTIRRCSRS